MRRMLTATALAALMVLGTGLTEVAPKTADATIRFYSGRSYSPYYGNRGYSSRYYGNRGYGNSYYGNRGYRSYGNSYYGRSYRGYGNSFYGRSYNRGYSGYRGGYGGYRGRYGGSGFGIYIR